METRPGAETALYEYLLRHYRGRGGRTEATAAMRRYLSGNTSVDDRVHWVMRGIQFGIEWSERENQDLPG